jgi:hypothetical protein
MRRGTEAMSTQGPSSGSTDLRVGGSIKVVAGEHHVGEIGDVRELYDRDVVVEFPGDSAGYAFAREEVVAIHVKRVTSTQSSVKNSSPQEVSAMDKIIARHKGELIGLNLEKPAEFNAVHLVDANESFITIEAENGSHLYYSTRYVIFASEGEFSLYTRFARKRAPVKLLVQVYHFLVYSGGGSVGVGIAF